MAEIERRLTGPALDAVGESYHRGEIDLATAIDRLLGRTEDHDGPEGTSDA